MTADHLARLAREAEINLQILRRLAESATPPRREIAIEAVNDLGAALATMMARAAAANGLDTETARALAAFKETT